MGDSEKFKLAPAKTKPKKTFSGMEFAYLLLVKGFYRNFEPKNHSLPRLT